MKTTVEFIYFISFFVTILMSALSFLTSRHLNSKEFRHLSEFWASLALMVVISYIFRNASENMVALNLIGWIWPLKTIIKVSQDMSGLELFDRKMIIIFAAGGFLTLALASYQYPFKIYVTPFCISTGIVGGHVLSSIYRNKINKLSVLEHTTYFLLGLFFLNRLLYPLWRMDEVNFIYGIVAHLLVLIGLAASTLSLYMEVMKEKHQKQLEGVLKERSDQLLGQSKYSELGMMSAGIAHEINNPLAIIQAKTTQLLRVFKNPDSQKTVGEGLEQILYTSERINRTIQGVREFVHQDERVGTEVIALKDLVDDVLAFTGQRMKNHGVNLRFYGLENYYVRGNKVQLEQVILNLLNNSFDAIEFLPDKWIELSVLDNKNMIQIYIKDSGPGIPPEIACRMMEPFFTTKKVGKGTGLGLAMARGIIERHGGSLVYISNVSHTTFLVELPKYSSHISPKKEDSRLPLLH